MAQVGGVEPQRVGSLVLQRPHCLLVIHPPEHRRRLTPVSVTVMSIVGRGGWAGDVVLLDLALFADTQGEGRYNQEVVGVDALSTCFPPPPPLPEHPWTQ